MAATFKLLRSDRALQVRGPSCNIGHIKRVNELGFEPAVQLRMALVWRTATAVFPNAPQWLDFKGCRSMPKS
jgi:hypothetical protein